MAAFTIAEVLQATHGRLIGSRSGRISGVSTDSRALRPGELFVALRGPRYDGHQFLSAALAAGASALLVSSPDFACPQPVIQVPDTLAALGSLAGWHRSRFSLPVIAVTGSTGKTTTKEMASVILEAAGLNLLKTPENYNNEIGVPLALLSLEPAHQAAVLELAMRGPGQISYLAGLVRPTIGVITNIGLSHLELLGSQRGIALAKAELLERMPDGVAVLNAGDPYFSLLRERARGRVVTFGLEAGDVQARGLERAGLGWRFRLNGLGLDLPVELPALGRHNVLNALAAAAAAREAGAAPDAVGSGLAAYSGGPMRMQMLPAPGDFTVISDCYNASPASVKMALEALAGFPGPRFAVLGEMRELGPDSERLHQQVGACAAEAGLDLLVAVGEMGTALAAGAAEAGMTSEKVALAGSNHQAVELLRPRLGPGAVVLVKGSRALGMEEIVAELTGER